MFRALLLARFFARASSRALFRARIFSRACASRANVRLLACRRMGSCSGGARSVLPPESHTSKAVSCSEKKREGAKCGAGAVAVEAAAPLNAFA
eukprot:3439091-Pleurochrysis_carterae.AAC.1